MDSDKLNVRMVLEWLDSVAPFATQEEFDNGGLQVGNGRTEVTGILVTLDVTVAVIKEALALKTNLIVSHHPLIFVAQKDLATERFVPELLTKLIRNDLALISSHTSMDQSEAYSASAALAKLLKLKNIRKQGAYLFLGELPTPQPASKLNRVVADALAVPARLYGNEEKVVSTLAIAGGAYSEGFRDAAEAGAQALLTGEVRHHHAVEANALGMALIDGGHFGTEATMLQPLAFGLQKMANAVRYPVQVYVSQCDSYRLQ